MKAVLVIAAALILLLGSPVFGQNLPGGFTCDDLIDAANGPREASMVENK